MTATSASALAFAALLANLAFVATGCGSSAGDASVDPAADTHLPTRSDDGTDEGPKAPPVGGPATTSELTDELGIFVAPNGKTGAEGTHARPLASIQAGIELAKRAGKRVYVCTGTFREAITVADSISIVGALDCTAGEWRTGAPRTRVESPSSPAVTATDIKTATRVEGLEITAPNATEPSGSSIALLATHASSLVIASTKLASGSGMKGDSGTDGLQLADSPTAHGAPATPAASCGNGGCTNLVGYVRPPGAAAGTNVCTGAPGHEAQPGGNGGSSGLWEPFVEVGTYHFKPYADNPVNVSDIGITNRTGAPGLNGADGANAPALGSFTSSGYTAAIGNAGADGAPGRGGAGGAGRTPEPDINPAVVGGVWRGYGGAGGGAGGCPGLAGSAGKGGGASIAALLVDSKVTFDAAELRSFTGGDAGRGSFGSMPTVGGHRGINVYYSFMGGKDGGPGGAPGFSGNGSNGPSIGIAHVGVAPVVGTSTTITSGSGGAAIEARSRSTFGVLKTIPATPAGLSKDILAL